MGGDRGHADRRGVLFIISAPSGAGKTTLVRRLIRELDGLAVSISHTTRPKRPGEAHNRDYYFVSEPEFMKMVAADDFLEHAVVFGHHYGTARKAVQDQLAAGTDTILEIDWQGARQVRERIPGTTSIFILPPSYDSLRERLQNRRQDDAATMARRLRAALDEISHWGEYDYQIVNDDLDRALAELKAIVTATRCARPYRCGSVEQLVARLMAEAAEIQ
jgi:guanylate kinase